MFRARGLLYSFGLVFGAIGSFLVLIPWCLLMPLNKLSYVAVVRRSYLGVVTQMFFSFAAVMIEYICGTKIYIHGTDCRLLSDKGVLVLANHRTRVDWMYGGWSYATLLNNYPQLAFILKRSLKDVPFFGWCMQIMMYIFLERKSAQDLPKIDKVIRYLKSHDLNSSVFIFPEGTDLSESNIAKSNKFAEDNKLTPLKYVLYPKPTGFVTCLNIFKQFHKVVDAPSDSATDKLLADNAAVLHNITIAYKDHTYGKRTTDGSIVKGEFPSEIHMLVQRVSLSSIPSTNPAATAEWLRGVFLEKEKQLKSFYEHPSVVSNGVVGSTANIDLWPAVVFVSSSLPLWKRVLQMTVLPVCTVLCLVLFHYNRWYRYAVILFSILFVASPLFNGFDNLELAMTDNHKLLERQQQSSKKT